MISPKSNLPRHYGVGLPPMSLPRSVVMKVEN
jgi:hypothetical protein